MLGEDIRPVVRELVGLGFNVVRVFSMYDERGIGRVNGLGRLTPYDVRYKYSLWTDFARVLAEFGMRLEVVGLADTEWLGVTPDLQQPHLNALYNQLEPEWNASFIETCNEPAKNGVDTGAIKPRKGLILRASGQYDVEDGRVPDVLDYVTLHTERKFEWPRTCRTLSEFRDGAEGLEAVRVPVVSDEPTGFAEAARPDSRSGPGYFPDDGQVTPANPEGWSYLDDARQYAACSQMHGAGSTFHYDDGVTSVLMGPNQKRAAQAWLEGAKFMPVEAQFAEYQRGGYGGGAGIGNMPIDHHDLDESTEPRALRTYAKRGAGRENCVAIRDGRGWFPKMLRGCTLIRTEANGLVEVKEL